MFKVCEPSIKHYYIHADIMHDASQENNLHAIYYFSKEQYVKTKKYIKDAIVLFAIINFSFTKVV